MLVHALLGLSICHVTHPHLVQVVKTGLEPLEEKAPGGNFKDDQLQLLQLLVCMNSLPFLILVSPKGDTTRLPDSTFPIDKLGPSQPV